MTAWHDEHLARALAGDAPLPPMPGLAREFAAWLDSADPGTGWMTVFALQWRTTSEQPCIDEFEAARLNIERGWYELHPDGSIPLDDGRRVRLTDTGRAAAREVLL